MTNEQDIMRVIDDAGAPAVDAAAPAWKIAVIDDDAAVHEGTRFALYDYSLHGQGIEIISAYLPKQLSDIEAAKEISALIKEIGAETLKDMGKTMAALKQRFAGRMDFGKAGAEVKKHLGGG